MNYKLLIPVIFIGLTGCSNKPKKATDILVVSINKVWQFKNIDTSSSHFKRSGSLTWVGNNVLDLTKKDTLKFSYGSTHNKPSSYPYRVSHDTIFIQSKPAYKILKLTGDELHLLVAFKNNRVNKAPADSTVMLYKVKK